MKQMKIKKIEIFSYGKWVNQTFYLNDDLNVFLGRNGAGKTSLASFILSILFGFPDMRKKGQRDYDTNPQMTFGGRLYVHETCLGEVVLERTRQAGRVNCLMKVDNGTPVEVNDFSEVLGGLTKKEYLRYFGFNEQELMNFLWEDEAELSNSLLSMGLSGRQVLTQLKPKLEARSEELYKRQGQKPALNQQFEQLAEVNSQLEKAKASESRYYDLKQAKEEIKQRLESLKEKEQAIRIKQGDLRLANDASSLIARKQALSRELIQYQFRDFPSDFKEQWLEVSHDLAEAKKYMKSQQSFDDQATSLYHIGDDIKDERKPSTSEKALTPGEDWLIDHLEQGAAMLKEARSYHQEMADKQEISDRLAKNRYIIERNMKALGAETRAELPNPLSEVERQAWQKRKTELDNRRIFYENTKQELEKNLQEKQSLEAEYAEVSDRFEAFKDTIAERTSHWMKTFGLTLLIFGLVLFFLYFFALKQEFLMFSGGIAASLGLLCAIVGFIQSALSQKAVKEENQAFSLDLRDINSEKAEITRQIDLQNDRLHELERDSANFMAELEQAVIDHGGSQYIEPLVWLDNTYVEDIIRAEIAIDNLMQEVSSDYVDPSLEEAWGTYRKVTGLYTEDRGQVYQQFEREYLHARDLGVEYRYQQAAKVKEAEAYEKAKAHYDQIKKRMDYLTERYQIADGEDVLSLIAKEEDMKAKKEELNHLANNLKPSLDRYYEEGNSVSVEALIQDVSNQLQKLESEKEELLRQYSQIATDIKALEQSGRLDRIEQSLNDEVEKATDLASEYLAQKLAIAAIENATYEADSKAMDPLLAQANENLKILSGGRLGPLTYRDGQLRIQVLAYEETMIKQLSTGERALLFVAMRFAFLNSELQQVQLPIIIDEAFSQLDDIYSDAIYQFIAKYSETGQVLLFTIDEYLAEQVHNDYIIRLMQARS